MDPQCGTGANVSASRRVRQVMFSPPSMGEYSAHPRYPAGSLGAPLGEIARLLDHWSARGKLQQPPEPLITHDATQKDWEAIPPTACGVITFSSYYLHCRFLRLAAHGTNVHPSRSSASVCVAVDAFACVHTCLWQAMSSLTTGASAWQWYPSAICAIQPGRRTHRVLLDIWRIKAAFRLSAGPANLFNSCDRKPGRQPHPPQPSFRLQPCSALRLSLLSSPPSPRLPSSPTVPP